ncbi:MAG: PilZ domain-containing protein [Sulfuriflexus sp.]|nr:PilZ domain-containing protein [Sulfuriflexus sp.]
MVDSDDKRDFRRMSVDSDITVCLLGSSNVITARMKDLSASGLQFHTSHELMVGEELEVNIEPGKAGSTLPFHALVRVVHIEEIVPETEYAIGCKIKEMLPVTE